jgi:hypothetical protein
MVYGIRFTLSALNVWSLDDVTCITCVKYTTRASIHNSQRPTRDTELHRVEVCG